MANFGCEAERGVTLSYTEVSKHSVCWSTYDQEYSLFGYIAVLPGTRELPHDYVGRLKPQYVLRCQPAFRDSVEQDNCSTQPSAHRAVEVGAPKYLGHVLPAFRLHATYVKASSAGISVGVFEVPI